MFAREHLKYLCPRAKESYIEALTDPGDWGWGMLQRYEVIASRNRFLYFMANGFHETGGLTVEAENMSYSAARLRVVWPSRFKNKSDSELAPLVRNPVALSMNVYNGRMGNRIGTKDGYYFRGHGKLQVTGRGAYLRYGNILGINFDAEPDYVDSMPVMLALSAVECYVEGLNDIADEGDFDGYCAKLNTGSRTRVKGCVGLADRRKWLAKLSAYLNREPEIDDPPAALIEEMHPDGDTVPGQDVHFMELRDQYESNSVEGKAQAYV